MKSIKSKKVWTDSFEAVNSSFEDLETLNEFVATGDATHQEIDTEYKQVLVKVEDLEFQRMLSSEEDQLDAMLEINPGLEEQRARTGRKC